jgi:putative ABC transport system permease protein
MAIPFAYNFRNVLRRPANTIATAIGIGLVVAILIGAFALAAGFQAALVESGSPQNVIVLRTGADSEISSGVSLEGASIVRALPEVATAPDGRPLVSAELLVLTNLERKGQSGSSNVPIRGIQMDGLLLRNRMEVTAGRMFMPGTDEVIVGERISKRFKNCGLGDELRFGQRAFHVVGLFRAGGSSFDSEIWGDQAVLGPALGREGFQSVTFRMRDTSQFRAIESQLESDPRLGVQVRTERAFYSSQAVLLANVIRVAGVFITLIMAIGAIFGAINTMYAAVGTRTREIAVLLTLGFSPFAVLTSFMTESVILALIGGLLGCILALPINGIVTSTTNWSSFSEVAFAFKVTPIAMVFGLVFAAAMGSIGGFLPALKAARQSLATSLREM